MVIPSRKDASSVSNPFQMTRSSHEELSIFRAPSAIDLPTHILKDSNIEPRLRGKIMALLKETDLTASPQIAVLKLLLDQKSTVDKVKLIREFLQFLK